MIYICAGLIIFAGLAISILYVTGMADRILDAIREQWGDHE